MNREEHLTAENKRLRKALEGAERKIVSLYNAACHHGQYTNELGIDGHKSGNRFADTDEDVLAARTALSESKEQPDADGWVLVPSEPTEAMNVAGCKEDDILGELVDWRSENTTTREAVARVYRAMIAAAPVTP